MTGFISSPYSLVVPSSLTAPTFFADGGVFSGVANITPFLPTGHVANDILLLVIETNPNLSSAPSAPAGYVEVTGSPIADTGGLSADQTRLQVFWKRDNGAESNPTVVQTGDHVSGVIFGFRGCKIAGDPWNAVAVGIGTGAQTSLTLPAVVTTVENTLLVNMVSVGTDANGVTHFSAWANASLTGLTEIEDYTLSTGTGTGLGVNIGTLVTIGSSGATTVTGAVSERHAYMTLALHGVI